MNEIDIEWVAFMVHAGLESRGVETTVEAELAELQRWLNAEKADAVRMAAGMFTASLTFPREIVMDWMEGRAASYEANQ